ncbi:MAG: hypothetical protein KDK33_20865, partial [Leptospiraceae bacterium]|nr:hypothetical protein [Leptospiraceae bacterium]
FPFSVVRLSGGADFGGGSYYLGIVDSSATNRCHIYKSATGSEDPQTAMTKVQLSCGTSSDLGMPAVYADDNRVLAAYRYNSAAATGLFVSSDQGSSFQSVDLSSVWNSSGYITSIAKEE